MNNSEQIEITKKYFGLFIGQGDKKLCTPYGLKHKVERFAEHFTMERTYIPEKSAITALNDMSIHVDEEGYVIGEWIYPSLDELVETIGNNDFEKHFALQKYHTPFYRIPSMRVTAMIEAYSYAYERTGKEDFPVFDSYLYESLKWIEVDGGALSYREDGDAIILDTIYVQTKRGGVGTKLFELFLDEVLKYQDECVIEIDAYTDDSKEFFSSMQKKYDFFKPSKRLTKPDTYSIAVSELKKGEKN